MGPSKREDRENPTVTQALGTAIEGKRYRDARLRVETAGAVHTFPLRPGRNLVGSSAECDLRLEDPAVSRQHVEITDQPEGYLLRDLGSKNGTRVNGTLAREVFLLPDSRIELGSTVLRFEVEKHLLAPSPNRSNAFEGLVAGRKMREVLGYIERIAPTALSVLLLGETGTGKEVLARAIHQASSRAAGPYHVFDCASVDPGLVGAALFGQKAGAFTGATQAREGAFRSADGGTLFIDEIGELPLDLQPKLLRVLEQREVQALGSDVPVKVDVRIVSATHRDLRQQVDRNQFRRDLYYRLAGMVLEIPSLRERPEDVIPLAEQFGAQAGHAIALDESARTALMRHAWPGNIRELRNVIERACALSAGGRIQAADLALDPPSGPVAASHAADADERRRVEEALAAAQGNVARAARDLGVSRQTLYTRMERLGLHKRSR